jgi:hypothetical protein
LLKIEGIIGYGWYYRPQLPAENHLVAAAQHFTHGTCIEGIGITEKPLPVDLEI